MTPAGIRRSRRTIGITAGITAVVLIAALVAMRLSPDPPTADDVRSLGAAVAAQHTDLLLVPTEGTLLGGWVSPDDKTAGVHVQQELWRSREALIERPFDIGHQFYPFGEPFPGDMELFHISAGRIPMISWNGTEAARILDGTHDDLIRERARTVRDLDVPLFFRFWWEMDIEAKQPWVSDPDEFIDAWRYVHRMFEEEGARNAAWVWCPTSLAFTKGEAEQWYPGNGWVDWVCADGYNFAPTTPADPWRSFEDIFSPFYEWAVETGKPIMIGEFGVLEREPGEKAEWLRQAQADLEERFPKIRAVVYFDSRRVVDGSPRNWRIDTSESSAEAFADLAQALEKRTRR